MAFAQAIALLASFALIKLVASVADRQSFAAFAIVVALGGAANTLVFGPLGQWALRHYQESQENGELRAFYRAATISVLAGTALLAAASMPLLFDHALLRRLGLTPTLLGLSVALGVVWGCGDICVFIANAALRRRVAGALLIVQAVGRPMAIGCALLFGQWSVVAWVTGILLFSAGFLAIALPIVIGRDLRAAPVCDVPGGRHLAGLVSYTVPFVIWGVPSYAVSFGDRLLVGYLGTPGMLAIYVAMTTATTTVANGLSAVLARVFEPLVFSRAGDGSDPERERAAHRLVNMSTLLGIGVALFVAIAAWLSPDLVLRVFTSSRYTAGGSRLWMLALAGAAFVAGQQLIVHGFVAKRPWLYVPVRFAHAAALVGGLFALVPRRGLDGAVESVLGAQLLQLALVVSVNAFGLDEWRPWPRRRLSA